MANDNYVGKTVGNYRLIDNIGGGSFGSIYRAEHLYLENRIVAVKVMYTAHLDSEEDRERFLKEARLLSQLKHPHILALLDVGLSEGFPYLVTEFAAKGSLRDRLRKQQPELLSPREALTILAQVGEAISVAHKQNIIHRDVKPANILFQENGDALLADFGIATTLASASIKNINEMTGSAPYMAPEQFQGRISKECDQYALGCIAYELFTGHLPFNAPDFVSMAFKHLTEPPAALRQFDAAIPVYVEQAVLRALAKERTDRFPDILDFIAALKAPMKTSSTLFSETGPMSITAMPTAPTGPVLVEVASPVNEDMSTKHVVPNPITPEVAISEEFEETVRSFRSEHTAPIMTVKAEGPIEAELGTIPAIEHPFTIEAVGIGSNQLPPEKPKRRRRGLIFLIAAILAILLLLIPLSVAAFYTFAYPATALVSLSPVYKDIKASFTINSVAGKADVTKNQVAATHLLTVTEKKTQSVSATGSVATNPVQAGGTLTITNGYSQSVSFGAGTPFANNNKDTATLSQGATIPPGGTVTLAAYVSSATGAASNLPAGAINNSYCDQGIDPNCSQGYPLTVTSSAFVGGQDAGTYMVVQQSDIDTAAGQLSKSLTQDAKKALQSQVKPNELSLGTPQCSSQHSSDQNAGDAAANLNLTVTVTCTDVAYDPTPAQVLAVSLLKTQATTAPGPHYSLYGGILTTAMPPTITNQKNGNIAQVINTEGVWRYNFSNAEQQVLARFIGGKTLADAQALLLRQDGIRAAHVSLAGTFWIWNTVPTKADHITFVIDGKGIPQFHPPAPPIGTGGNGTRPVGTGTPTRPGTPTGITPTPTFAKKP